jgi:DNA-binding transcriptional LysR family regulator
MKWLLPRLSQFQAIAPKVELRLATSNAPVETLETFDVAVRRGPAHWANCASGHFLDETEIPVCSPALLQRSPITVADDLAKHVLLHSDTRPDAWRHWLGAAGVKAKCRKKQSFDHFYLALQAAVDGLGVALGPLPLLSEAGFRTPRVAARRPAHRCARLLVGGAARSGRGAACRVVLSLAGIAGRSGLTWKSKRTNENGRPKAARHHTEHHR